MIVPILFMDKAIASAKITSVDPLLLCAISKHETNFGVLGAGRQGYELGYGQYSDNVADPRFKGLDNQLLYAGKQWVNFTGGASVTFSTLLNFSINSWKAGNPQAWANDVWYWYQKIKEEQGGVNVNVVIYFGSDDMILAKRVAGKVNGVIADRTFIVPSGAKVFVVGGTAIVGAVNLTGNAWEDTAEAVIKFLRT